MGAVNLDDLETIDGKKELPIYTFYGDMNQQQSVIARRLLDDAGIDYLFAEVDDWRFEPCPPINCFS